MARRDVPLSTRPDGVKDRTVVAAGDKEESPGKDRARHNGIAFAVQDAPDLPAVGRIVGEGGTARRAHHERLALRFDDQGRAEGKLPLGRRFAGRLPADFSILRVQGHKPRFTRAVDPKDQQAVHQYRRTAVAMHRRVAHGLLPPNNLPGQVQGRRPMMSEVNIQPVLRDDRGGTRLAVLRMDRCPSVRGIEQRRFPKRLARDRIQRQRLQRQSTRCLLDRGGQVDPTRPEDR